MNIHVFLYIVFGSMAIAVIGGTLYTMIEFDEPEPVYVIVDPPEIEEPPYNPGVTYHPKLGFIPDDEWSLVSKIP